MFRSALERAIDDESRPIEEQLRRQLTSIIQDCQNQIIANYRSRIAVSANSPSLAIGNATSQAAEMCTGTLSKERQTSNQAEPLYRLPSPQNHLRSTLEPADRGRQIPLLEQEPKDHSYSSEPSTSNSSLDGSLERAESNTTSISDPQFPVSVMPTVFSDSMVTTVGLLPPSPENAFNTLKPKPNDGEQEVWDTTNATWLLENDMIDVDSITWNPTWESWFNADAART